MAIKQESRATSPWIVVWVITGMCGIVCLMNTHSSTYAEGKPAYTENPSNGELRDEGPDPYKAKPDSNQLSEAGEPDEKISDEIELR